jgi:hypothetical protein
LAAAYSPGQLHRSYTFSAELSGFRLYNQRLAQVTLDYWLHHTLGRVDGFDQEEDTSESDESGIVLLCLLTSHGDTFETLELSDQLLDAGA